jgi:hypothetical protein
MSDPRNLELGFWDCAGLWSESDVIEVVQLLGECGVMPGVGPWTPTATPRPVAVEEIPPFLPTVHFESPALQRKGGGRKRTSTMPFGPET